MPKYSLSQANYIRHYAGVRGKFASFSRMMLHQVGGGLPS